MQQQIKSSHLHPQTEKNINNNSNKRTWCLASGKHLHAYSPWVGGEEQCSPNRLEPCPIRCENCW